MKTALWILLLIFMSAFFALVQNKLIWGYWIQRPCVMSSFVHIDKVIGVSSLRPIFLPKVSSNGSFISEALARCKPISKNECLEGRLLLSIDGQIVNIGEVRTELLQEAWSTENNERPLPNIKNATYIKSAVPMAGLGIHFIEGGVEYIALAYRTSEISNDRYIYSEVLYRRGNKKLEIVRQVRFFYEISGLEIISFRFLVVTNFVCLAICTPFIVSIWKKIRK